MAASRKIIPEQESSGQILAGLLPAGARLVKAFGTLSAPTLSATARREPERAVQFYAADDEAAGDLVAELIWADEVLLDPHTLERSCVHLQNGDRHV